VLNVQGTAANAVLTTVDTGGGNDTIVVSSTGDAAGVLTGIQGPLAVDGGPGANSLWISELASTAADDLVLTGNDLSSNRGTFAPIRYSASAGSFSALVLRTGSGSNIVNVQGTAANVEFTTVGAFGSNNLVTVSSRADGNGVLDGIRGRLAIDAAAGSSGLIVSEGGNANPDQVVLTAVSLTSGLSTFAPINYVASGGSFGGGIALYTGAGDDFVNVQSTRAGTATAVFTGVGNDTIVVSSSTDATGNGNGVLSLLQGPLTIDAGGGANQFIVSDVANASADAVTFTDHSITSDGGEFAPITYQATGGSFAVTPTSLAQTTSAGTLIQAGIALLLGQANNTLHLTSQLSGASTYINMGQVPTMNTATVDVSSTSGYQGLTVDLGPGFNSLTLNDISGGGHTTIVPGPFPNSGMVLAAYPDGLASEIDFFGAQVVNGF
jgi:hypothetical protein